jgi:hypothetical protein
MSESLRSRIEALEDSVTFSELKRSMLALVEGGELEALDALLPRLIRIENENLHAIVGRAAADQWGESILQRINLEGLSPGVKENAFSMCRWVGGEQALAMLTEGLKDPEPGVRRHAAILLGSPLFADPRTYEALERAARSDEDAAVRRAALKAIAATLHHDAGPVLERIHEETGDARAENLLIDLRLRLRETAEKEAGGPEGGGEGPEEESPPEGFVPPAMRRSTRLERLADKGRQAVEFARSAGLSVVRSRTDSGRISPWRVGVLLMATALIVVAAVHYRSAVREMNPRPEAETYICPACGLHQKQVLEPGSRCERCGAYFFADTGWEEMGGPVLDGRPGG